MTYVGWDGREYEDPERRVEERWDDRCCCCGLPNEFDADRVPVESAEVVDRTTGARGLAHVECYLADKDCYELA